MAERAHEILTRAAALVGGDRQTSHGDKEENFANIAELWNAYLSCRIRNENEPKRLTALDVGHMMVLMKIARTQAGAFNIDDYIDAAGYAGCAAEIAAARTDSAHSPKTGE